MNKTCLLSYGLSLASLFVIPLVYFLLSKGIFLTIVFDLDELGLVLLFVYLRPKAAFWSVLVLMTVAELGYNAYLSQVTLGYADAYKFHDTTHLGQTGD